MEKDSLRALDPVLANIAAYSNSSKGMAPGVQSTGFRTNALHYSTLSHSNTIRLAENFLTNTRLLRSDQESRASIESYFADSGAFMISMLGHEQKKESRELKLPKGVRLQMGIGEVLSRRRSIRNYTGDSIELDYLSTILKSASGITGYAELQLTQGGEATFQFRTVPSGGGLYPIDLYVVVLRVRDLERGIYRYDPVTDTLLHTGSSSDTDKLLQCFAVTDEVIAISRANAVFLLVGRPWRSMRKYGDRGMRYVFLEAGAIAEHINLAIAALGLGSVDCASVYDDEVHEVMNLDGLYEALLHTIVMGCPG